MIVAEGGRDLQSKECVSHTHSSFSTKSGTFFAFANFQNFKFLCTLLSQQRIVVGNKVLVLFGQHALLLDPAVSCCLVCCTDTHPGTGPGY